MSSQLILPSPVRLPALVAAAGERAGIRCLEFFAGMANHASTRTTQFYDRRRDEISLDEVERIRV